MGVLVCREGAKWVTRQFKALLAGGFAKGFDDACMGVPVGWNPWLEPVLALEPPPEAPPGPLP